MAQSKDQHSMKSPVSAFQYFVFVFSNSSSELKNFSTLDTAFMGKILQDTYPSSVVQGVQHFVAQVPKSTTDLPLCISEMNALFKMSFLNINVTCLTAARYSAR